MITSAEAAALCLDMVLAGAIKGKVKIEYHQGNLARDQKKDKKLAEVAKRVRLHSDARFDIVSVCGHIRGEEKGDGTLRLFHRHAENGKVVYLAVKP